MSNRPCNHRQYQDVSRYLGSADHISNVNPTVPQVVHGYIGPFEMLRISWNAVQLDLPDEMVIYEKVNFSILTVDHTDDCSIVWQSLPHLLPASGMAPSHDVQSIRNHRTSS